MEDFKKSFSLTISQINVSQQISPNNRDKLPRKLISNNMFPASTLTNQLAILPQDWLSSYAPVPSIQFRFLSFKWKQFCAVLHGIHSQRFYSTIRFWAPATTTSCSGSGYPGNISCRDCGTWATSARIPQYCSLVTHHFNPNRLFLPLFRVSQFCSFMSISPVDCCRHLTILLGSAEASRWHALVLTASLGKPWY